MSVISTLVTCHDKTQDLRLKNLRRRDVDIRLLADSRRRIDDYDDDDDEIDSSLV